MKRIPLVPLAIISIFLGLAPFVPEPHLFGKVRWVMGGAVGMKLADWMDLLMHGGPIVLLVFKLIHMATVKETTTNNS